MAAPVHRFAALEPPPRRPPRTNRHNGPSIPAVHSARRAPPAAEPAPSPSLYVQIPPEPPQPTIASLAAARSLTPDTLLRTAALGLQDTPIMTPHLKFGLMVSLALATFFIVTVQYYIADRPVKESRIPIPSNRVDLPRGEMGAICATVASVCGGVCVYWLCKPRRHTQPAQPDRVSSTAQRRAPSSEPSDDISLGTLLQTVSPPPPPPPTEEAPPPYHIAVLLPPRERCSPPPPAYDALR